MNGLVKKANALKKNKKGFTLIEIIVVLVILAVLAAASIPAMMGFVNDAKGKAIIAEARAAYVAAQMIATEDTAAGFTPATIITTIENTAAKSRMRNLLTTDAPGTISGVTMGSDGKVNQLTYTGVKNDYKVDITGGVSSTVTKL